MSQLPTKEQVVDAHSRMMEFFQDNFKNDVLSHLNANHTYMYGKSIFKITETLSISKELAIYVLMGSNRRLDSWGDMKEKFGLDSVRSLIIPILRTLATEVNATHYYKIIFTDRPQNNGNFKLKIEFKELKKTGENSVDSDGFKQVKPRMSKTTETKKTTYSSKVSSGAQDVKIPSKLRPAEGLKSQTKSRSEAKKTDEVDKLISIMMSNDALREKMASKLTELLKN